MTLNVQTPVGQIVTERLGRATVLDRLGIDYCCRGKMTLGQACAERGIELGEVLRALSAVEIDAASADQVEYSALPAGALADHIVETHHTYLARFCLASMSSSTRSSKSTPSGIPNSARCETFSGDSGTSSCCTW